MPAHSRRDSLRAGRRAALRAGRLAARRAALRHPSAGPPPDLPALARELDSSSPADPKPIRVRLKTRTRFEFASALEAASSSIPEREAVRLAARAYRRALARLAEE